MIADDVLHPGRVVGIDMPKVPEDLLMVWEPGRDDTVAVLKTDELAPEILVALGSSDQCGPQLRMCSHFAPRTDDNTRGTGRQ